MSGLTGYLLSNGTDLSNVFMNINTPSILLNVNNVMTNTNTFTNRVDLSGSFLYGRNDGYNFTSSQSTPYSIGYTILFNYSTATTIVAGTIYNTSVALSVGLWILNGYLQIVQGGTFNYNVVYPYAYIFNSAFTGTTIYTALDFVYPIGKDTSIGTANPTFPFSNIFNVINNESITINIAANMVVGTSRLKLVGGFTKIA